jgi:hypothetical protein
MAETATRRRRRAAQPELGSGRVAAPGVRHAAPARSNGQLFGPLAAF